MKNCTCPWSYLTINTHAKSQRHKPSEIWSKSKHKVRQLLKILPMTAPNLSLASLPWAAFWLNRFSMGFQESPSFPTAPSRNLKLFNPLAALDWSLPILGWAALLLLLFPCIPNRFWTLLPILLKMAPLGLLWWSWLLLLLGVSGIFSISTLLSIHLVESPLLLIRAPSITPSTCLLERPRENSTCSGWRIGLWGSSRWAERRGFVDNAEWGWDFCFCSKTPWKSSNWMN